MKKVGVIDIGFKDGDNEGIGEVKNYRIDVVQNGYILTILDDEGDEFQYVEKDIDAVCKRIKKTA